MYIAVEPNTRMHPRTRAAAEHAGFTEAAGSLRILACGAEDTEAILAAAGGARVDTIVAVLVLCTVPAPQDTLRALVRDVLAPGGVFLFYEHVRSDVPAVSAFQGFLSPLWRSSTDGCNINRPTHKWVEELGEEGMWREGEVKKIGDGSGGGLFPPRWGMFVKA